jgi:hypothetical protein
MRSKEFIVEAPPNPEDSGGPARGTVAAAQADAARIEQGQKNLNALKGFFGVKPEELKDAPPGTSIDPVQRARMGYKPATQQEIAAFQAANPNYGKVVDRNGNPIKTGDGSDLVAGGEKGVVQTAQAAAPQRKGDAHAGQGGYNYQPSAPISATADAKSDILPPAGAAPAPSPAPAADDSAARAAAAAANAHQPVKSTEINPDLERIKTNAGISTTADAKSDILPPATPPAPSPAPEVPAPAVDTTGVGRVPGEAHAGQGGTEPVATTQLPTRPGQQTSGQAATPTKAAPKISPAIVGYASSMGLYKNGKPDPEAIKAFQQKNGLKADGIIGGNTSAAILSAAKPGDAGSSRGQQGGAPAPAPAKGNPPMPPTQPKSAPASPQIQPGQGGTPSVTPPKPVIGQTMPNGRKASQSDVLSWENQYGPGKQAAAAKATADATAAKTAYNPYAQNKVQEDIQRMRFLAGLSKD